LREKTDGEGGDGRERPASRYEVTSIGAHDPIQQKRTSPTVSVESADAAATNGSNPWLVDPVAKDLP
jgi:hypothetical protein